MKKLVSILLVAVLVMSVAVIPVFAETPPYSESFSSVEDMVVALEDYAQQFPHPDYTANEILPPNDDYHLENKTVVMPVLSEDYATLEHCTIMENYFEHGVDGVNFTYIVKETGKKYIIRGIYNRTADAVDDTLSGFGDVKKDPNVHIGFVNDYQYSAVDTPYADGKGTCLYKAAVDDVLFVWDELTLFNYDILSHLSFKKLDVDFPVYVRGEENLFEDEFLEAYSYGQYLSLSKIHYYEELYYHYNDSNEVDWALIAQCSYNSPPWNYHTIYKDRILMNGDYSPFSFTYGVYDVNEDKFYDILKNDFDFSKYDGLEKAFDDVKPGYPIGDADFDKELTILDATLIQRALAGLCDFHNDDAIYTYTSAWQNGSLKYMSDFDRDDERTIMDATEIQKKLAGLDKEPVENTEMVIKYLKDIEDPVLDVIPEEGRIEYEPVLGDRDVYVDVSSGRSNYIAIVKSEAHFEELFGCTDEKYNDEFFETKALVVALSHSNTAGFYTKVYGISVIEDKLYLCLVSEYENSGWVGVPDDTMYHNFVAVDKKDVAGVTDMCYVRYPFV